MTVTLAGVSKKGRERIKQHGAVWTIDPHGIHSDAILLHAPDGDWRWVQRVNDPHFSIVSTDEPGKAKPAN